MHALILALLLTGIANAETYHLWHHEPVVVAGKRHGFRSPHRAEASALVAALRAGGHTVIVHNAIVERTPAGISAYPALTTIYEGGHVSVVQGHSAARLDATRVTSDVVRLAKRTLVKSLAAGLELEASALRVQAAETALVADKLRSRGATSEADAKDAEADRLDAEADDRDADAVAEREKLDGLR